MPVNVRTSLNAALGALLLLAVFSQTAMSDESDEVGTYGDPLDEYNKYNNPDPTPDKTKPQDTDRDNDTLRDADRMPDRDRMPDSDSLGDNDNSSNSDRDRQRDLEILRDLDRQRDNESSNGRGRGRGSDRDRNNSPDRDSSRDQDNARDRDRSKDRDNERDNERDSDPSSDKDSTRDRDDTRSKRPSILRPGFQSDDETGENEDKEQEKDPDKDLSVQRFPPRQKARSRKRSVVPPRKRSRSRYTRSVRRTIRAHNKKGRSKGNLKLYAKENRWGAGIKIQSCYGDNILTKFTVIGRSNQISQKPGKIWFQFKDVTYRNKGRTRHKWIMVQPGMLIRGRHILLRAQASKGNGVLSLKVVGSCYD